MYVEAAISCVCSCSSAHTLMACVSAGSRERRSINTVQLLDLLDSEACEWIAFSGIIVACSQLGTCSVRQTPEKSDDDDAEGDVDHHWNFSDG